MSGVQSNAAPVETQGFLKFEYWAGMADGTAVDVLTSWSKYPSSPDLVSYTSAFNTRPVFPDDTHEQYGARISGWLTPLETGNYRFFIYSDDSSELWLSTDATEANAVKVAEETSCCTIFTEPDSPRTSEPISLTAGKKYWIYGLLKEGGGGDYVQVAWRKEGDTTAAASLSPIPSQYLSSTADANGGTIVFSQQPQSVTTAENTKVTFTAVATATSPYLKYASSLTNSIDPVYQWYKNGTLISDANSTNYTITWPKKATEGNAKYKCVVSIPGLALSSSEATLTVSDDTTPPTIVSANPTINSQYVATGVKIKFSEPVGPTAEVASNYTLDNGATVSSVSRVDSETVLLKTSTLAINTNYTLTVNGVQDLGTTPNNIAANSKFTFSSWSTVPGFLQFWIWNNESTSDNAIDTSILADPRYPESPDIVTFTSALDSRPVYPDDTHEGYAAKASGWITPTETGEYDFFLKSDDSSRFSISTDDKPANLVVVCEQTGCCNAFVEPSEGAAYTTATPISLKAGSKYYIEMLYKEGTGGDYGQVAWRKTTDTNAAAGLLPVQNPYLSTLADTNGALVKITTQPVSLTAYENNTASFNTSATGSSSAISYQWRKNGVTIPGATKSSYTTPMLAVTDDGAKFSVVVSVPGSTVVSSEAVLTVKSDAVPPTVVAASALKGAKSIGVTFSESVDTNTAQTVGNYTVAGATISSIVMYFNKYAELQLSSAINADFTLTVKNVKDLAGNVVSNTTLTGKISDLTALDVGDVGTDPLQPGFTLALGNDAYLVAGGGSDIWNNADACQFVYKEFTGAFDARVRVEAMNPNGPSTSTTWAKNELMVRESTAAGSRHNSVAVTRAEGENAVEAQWRDTTDGGCGNLRFFTPVPYPNAWLRLVREDATSGIIKAYTSTDGANWTLSNTHTTPATDPDPAFPAKVLIGLAVTSHDNTGNDILAQGVNLSFSVKAYTAVADPQLKVAWSNGKAVVSWASGTLVSSTTVNGTYAPVSGATSPFSVTPEVNKSVFYRVQQ